MKWPRELRHPLFLSGVVLYAVAASTKYGGPLTARWQLPELLRSYLADTLALPLELTLVLFVMRRWYFRRPRFVLPATWIFSTWVVFSIWFEALVPRFDARATADPLDVVAYAVGGLIFWRWLNRPDAPATEP
ncbi:hypothetical protein [Hymenobacter sp. AT01-02]|uniref:Magnesium citrate secondary transporter n=2 Tax=Hymenobacter mucosus TaxID=1411120 RepID=A0A238XGN6_9BACT|nr:hypothetical protein [Hymenobacter sp. AT01-02]SNR57862.1 hypothetical protein SAMN06269173_10472 [Hymenobacter mucosus]